jgi:hypothetical protein
MDGALRLGSTLHHVGDADTALVLSHTGHQKNMVEAAIILGIQD